MPSGTESIAVMPAILRRGIMEVVWMNKQQFQRETLYQATMYAVERLHRNGIITDAEYEICRIMMLEKYDPPIGKIVSN